jgi:hypothetical protein
VPTSALQLWVHQIFYSEARALNAIWHSTLPRIGDPKNVMSPKAAPCFAATFEGVIYAVAIWSHPVSRSLPQKTWLELRRLAVAPDAPKNTASRVLAVMTRLLREAKPGVERLISYQDTEAHTGCIYKAAGWVAASTTGSQRRWGCPSRPRPPSQSEAVKQRWEKVLT